MADACRDTKPDFFISRAGTDAVLAGEIGRILEDAGHRVILQQWDFANRSFMQQMHAALESGVRVIALLSPDYMNSEACQAEWQATIARDPLNAKGRLIVMRAVECAPRGLLASLAYWDLVPVRSNAKALSAVVLDAVRIERRKDTAGAARPYWREEQAVLHSAIHAVPNFTGRLEDIAALERALWSSGTAAITQAALQGLGGVGKSALAIQYAWLNRTRYAGVWRLEAETEAGIRQGLVQLGARFIRGIDEVPDQDAAVQTVLEFLAGGGFAKPWLLIYDNVKIPNTLYGLAPLAGAHVLITSRWSDWTGRAAPVPLGIFTLEEAVKYLLSRTHRKDTKGATGLAAVLGRLPLALEHAAAFCVETGDSFADYRQRLSSWIELAPSTADYAKSVFATFNLAIERAATACPEVETLMSIFTWMAPDNIPREIVSGKVMDAMTLRRATGALSKVSLITVSASEEGGPFVSMHRLVQTVMRRRLATRGEAETAAAIAIRLVTDAFPAEPLTATGPVLGAPSDVRSWPTCERLYPHAIALFESVPEIDETTDKIGHLCSQVAAYLTARALFSDAEPLWKRALSIFEGVVGADQLYLCQVLNGLRWYYSKVGRHRDARLISERVLSIYEEALAPQDARVGTALSSIGYHYIEEHNYAKAEPLFVRALSILEDALGPEHIYVGISLSGLARVYGAQGRFPEAETLHHRALSILEKAVGTDHPHVGYVLSDFGRFYQRQGHFAEAEPLFARALAIRERMLPPEHPDVGASLRDLADLFLAEGRHIDAEPLMRRAVKVFSTSLGIDHPDTQTLRNNYELLITKTKDV